MSGLGGSGEVSRSGGGGVLHDNDKDDRRLHEAVPTSSRLAWKMAWRDEICAADNGSKKNLARQPEGALRLRFLSGFATKGNSWAWQYWHWVKVIEKQHLTTAALSVSHDCKLLTLNRWTHRRTLSRLIDRQKVQGWVGVHWQVFSWKKGHPWNDDDNGTLLTAAHIYLKSSATYIPKWRSSASLLSPYGRWTCNLHTTSLLARTFQIQLISRKLCGFSTKRFRTPKRQLDWHKQGRFSASRPRGHPYSSRLRRRQW